MLYLIFVITFIINIQNYLTLVAPIKLMEVLAVQLLNLQHAGHIQLVTSPILLGWPTAEDVSGG